jgi:hypothetical protein
MTRHGSITVGEKSLSFHSVRFHLRSCFYQQWGLVPCLSAPLIVVIARPVSDNGSKCVTLPHVKSTHPLWNTAQSCPADLWYVSLPFDNDEASHCSHRQYHLLHRCRMKECFLILPSYNGISSCDVCMVCSRLALFCCLKHLAVTQGGGVAAFSDGLLTIPFSYQTSQLLNKLHSMEIRIIE